MDESIKIIKDYISELPKPRGYMDKHRFQQASYSHWAAEEILEKVRENRDTPAVIIIEQFARKMTMYSCRAGIRGCYGFAVAVDVAQDLLTKFV